MMDDIGQLIHIRICLSSYSNTDLSQTSKLLFLHDQFKKQCPIWYDFLFHWYDKSCAWNLAPYHKVEFTFAKDILFNSEAKFFILTYPIAIRQRQVEDSSIKIIHKNWYVINIKAFYFQYSI